MFLKGLGVDFTLLLFAFVFIVILLLLVYLIESSKLVKIYKGIPEKTSKIIYGYLDKKGNLIQEKKGMAPDIYTPASNAMARTLTLIKGKKNPFIQTLFLLSQLYSNLKKPKTRTSINNQNNQR